MRPAPTRRRNFTDCQSSQQRACCRDVVQCRSRSSIDQLLQLIYSAAAATAAATKHVNFLEEAAGTTACKAVLNGGGHDSSSSSNCDT